MADSAPVLDGPNDTGVQVDLDTSGQSTSAPTTNNVCTDTCKFKTKRSGKQHDMIQCSVCAQWYHTDCVGLKKGDPVGVWPCTSCRHIPEQIKTIVESLSTLTAAMNNISNINSNLTKQYETKYAECVCLRNENIGLKAQLADLTTTHYAQKPDLVIGDSLLRGINQTKLARTHVTSLPGARIRDVASNLARTETKYNRIVICAGTNDCNNEINIDATTEHLDHLLQVATERVACGSNVVLSSIPPRTDDVVRQQRVEELNTILQDVSAKVGVTFMSNDQSFRLADGQPNDGYLCKDGLHLNYRGTSRLIDNLRLTKLPAEDSKPVDNNERQTHSSKRKRAPVPSHQRRHDTDNNDSGNTTNYTINDGGDGEDTGEFSQPWTRVKYKARKALTTQNARNNSNNRSNKQKLRLSEHDIHNTPGRDSRRRSYSDVTRSTMTCEFCAEPGHSTRDCGFGDYATCRQCFQQGHKQKFCHAYTG